MSITVMEIVDNAFVLVVAQAFVAAFPVNRLLIAKGRGHAVMRGYH